MMYYSSVLFNIVMLQSYDKNKNVQKLLQPVELVSHKIIDMVDALVLIDESCSHINH